MGRTTKIDWADATWNPVTGCLNGCEYCYARKQAARFGGFDHDENKEPVGTQLAIGVQELDKPKYIMRNNGLQKAPYPWFFNPTTAEREEAKKELTGADGAASEEQVSNLKTLCKELMDKDETQEDFVQQIAMKTDGFTNNTASACTALCDNLTEIIAQYGD